MPRKVTIGNQNFALLQENNCFYVDKTHFIKLWWENLDNVTLITRPRRFGKTLMLDTVRTFFSPKYANRSDLFEGLRLWEDEEYRKLQGKIPVIYISFADFKSNNYLDTIDTFKAVLVEIYDEFKPNFNLDVFTDTEIEQLRAVKSSMNTATAQLALRHLSKYLARQYNSSPIILLDEYDSPLQESWLNGYWDELVGFLRGFLNSTFKSNPYLGRGLITGITRVAKESIFSDLNNLEVVTTTSDLYTDCFGFTEQEVFAAMDEYGLTDKEGVKKWYDGFIFGKTKEIYNPWSIINYLRKKELSDYWANTSSNKIISELLAQANDDVKEEAMTLMKGNSIKTKLREDIVYAQLEEQGALWSFMMASGYLKPINFNLENKEYELILTNYEVYSTIKLLISNWFNTTIVFKRKFIDALLSNDLNNINIYINHITKSVFSFFDTCGNTPERFYHGFVLGLIVDLEDRYTIKSNRESGYGRYDITLFPKKNNDPGIVIEFKTMDPKLEHSLKKTCLRALKQIRDKEYITELLANDVPQNNIYIYGFAFKGKNVLICGGALNQIDWTTIMKEENNILHYLRKLFLS